MTRTSPVVTISRVVSVVAVVVTVALLPWLSGRDPALSLLRARSAEQDPTPEALAAVRADLGLDAGPWALLHRWLSGVPRGDLGTSWTTGRPVLPDALAALGVSATLCAFALAVAAVVASIVVIPAVRAGLRGRPASSSGIGAAAATAMPEFLLASAAVVVAGVWLSFPPYGWTGPGSAVLPALALGIPAGGLLGRLSADAISGAFTEPWVTTWWVAGVPRRALVRAVTRRAASGVTTQWALVAVGLLGGAVAVETVFAVPGIGRAMLSSARSQDVPALQVDILLVLVVGALLVACAGLARRLLLGRTVDDLAVPVPGASTRRRRDRVVPLLAAAILAVVVAAGLPRDPSATSRSKFAAPSMLFPLGTDAAGRDVLARVAHGAAQTLAVSVAVAAVCIVLGLVLGSWPRLVVGPVEVSSAIPPVVAGIVVASALGPNVAAAAVAVAVTAWAPLAAHTAALSSEVAARPYVSMMPMLGAGRARVRTGSILPAVAPAVIRHGVLRIPGIALALASLGFLGLGSQPPSPEWGLVLADGVAVVERAPWVAGAPLVGLMLLAIAAVSAANAVRPRATC